LYSKLKLNNVGVIKISVNSAYKELYGLDPKPYDLVVSRLKKYVKIFWKTAPLFVA